MSCLFSMYRFILCVQNLSTLFWLYQLIFLMALSTRPLLTWQQGPISSSSYNSTDLQECTENLRHFSRKKSIDATISFSSVLRTGQCAGRSTVFSRKTFQRCGKVVTIIQICLWPWMGEVRPVKSAEINSPGPCVFGGAFLFKGSGGGEELKTVDVLSNFQEVSFLLSQFLFVDLIWFWWCQGYKSYRTW